MSLEINSTEQVIKIAAITLKGRLDAFEAPALRKICDDYISNEFSHFVFDLTDVAMECIHKLVCCCVAVTNSAAFKANRYLT